jgi:hypothetical protein
MNVASKEFCGRKERAFRLERNSWFLQVVRREDDAALMLRCGCDLEASKPLVGWSSKPKEGQAVSLAVSAA